jgi:hypothetical protein
MGTVEFSRDECPALSDVLFRYFCHKGEVSNEIQMDFYLKRVSVVGVSRNLNQRSNKF